VDDDEVIGHVEWPDICEILDIQESNIPNYKDVIIVYSYPAWPNRGRDFIRREIFIKEFEKLY
jgi:hypothetical protein